ncbi:MAG TPA: pilus assembly protein TadG-related protein [Candidatus Dormibacteraeota bacterium]|nr:pilus assembly protein TadG-related protein [Candidatus Dormibacteraeota bacterium]
MLVLFAVGLIALLAGVAIVVDGGNVFAQQRVTQNAADASADAGAAVLIQNVAVQVAGTLPKTDADVLNAVNSVATSNGIATPIAYYTTVKGNCILSDQTAAAPPCTVLANAVRVGSGLIPTVGRDASNNPQCPLPYYSDTNGDVTPSTTPASACGVAVYGSKTFPTYVARSIGISQMSASAAATAVAGAQVTICPAGAPCGFLPITFPSLLTACGSTNKLDLLHQLPYLIVPQGTALTESNESIIQICGTNAGSVGFIAIQPEDGNGVNDLGNDIVTPDNPPLFLPFWANAQTGNTNAIEAQVNTYAGQIVGTYEPGLDQPVTLPIYDCTASVSVVGGQQNPATNPAQCSGLSPSDLNGGTGNNLYYHIPVVAAFVLDHAYIQGKNKTECNSAPGIVIGTGNGATSCLKGWFTSISSPSTGVGAGFGQPNTAFGIQLIR